MIKLLNRNKKKLLILTVVIYIMQCAGIVPFPKMYFMLKSFIHQSLIVRTISEIESFGQENDSDHITIDKNGVFDVGKDNCNLLFHLRYWGATERKSVRIQDKQLEMDVIRVMISLHITNIWYTDRSIMFETRGGQGIIVTDKDYNPYPDDLKDYVNLGNNMYYFKKLSAAELHKRGFS